METTLQREVICGDFPDLEDAFTECIQSSRRADPLAPLIVLVPTNLLRRHLAHSLADRGVPHLNVRFVTIDTFVHELIAPQLAMHGAMPKFADELLMAEACRGHGDQFYFANLADRPGLHRSLLGSIQDLKEAGVDLATFQAALPRLNGLYKSARAKLESLLAVWRRHEELKQQYECWDEADQYIMATQMISANSAFHVNGTLFVYGLYDFKRIQARLILAAATKLHTTIFFPFESTAAWEYAKPTLEMLLRLGFRKSEVGRRAGARSELLQRLCDRLFATRPQGETYPLPQRELESGTLSQDRLGNPASTDVGGLHVAENPVERLPIQIVSLPGETREALELPRIVMELARADGMKFRDIAVLPRSRAATDRTLREAFNQAALPASSPNGVLLRESHAGRSILLMLQVLKQDFARRDVMELLTFADIDFQVLAGLADPPTATWDALTMRAGIVRGRDQWLRRLTSLQGRLSRAKGERTTGDATNAGGTNAVDPSVVASLVQTMHGLFKPLESIARSRTWADLIDRTTTAFQTLMRASAEREQIITALVELRRLDTLKPGPNPGLLTRLVEETLETESSERAQGETDGTTLSPLMQARGVPFRAVIVPGLIERSFPQSPSIDPILLDHERQKLNEVFGAIVAPVPSPDAPGSKVHRDVASLAIHAVGQADVLEASDAISTALPPLLPLKVAQISEERLLFRLAVGAARERLVLTFSRIEAESGRERVPSYFLLRTIDALAETQAPPVNGAAVQREPRNEQPWSRPVQSLTPSRRRGKAASRGQLVLPFVMTDSLAAPGVKQLENSTLQLLDPGIESNPVGRIVPATVAMLVRWPGFRHVSLSELAPSPARAVSLAEHDLGAALAESRASHGQSVVLGACASISPHFARAVVAERLRWEQRSFTRYDGLIQDAELLALLRRNSPLLSPISPSRIEDYARCPFHFYMHNLLGLEELEEPELLARSDPAAKGKLVHAILADFLQKMKKRGRLPLTANHTKYLLAIARKYLREFEESGMAGPGLTWQVEREQLLKFFHQFMEREIEWQHEQGYRPDQFELPFGRHDAPEGLSNESAKFDLGNGQVLQFRGIIDRVDISKDGKQLYVIDYKGRQLPNPGKEGFGLGTVVQLPIYLLGAQTALLPKGRFGAAGGAYISYQPEVDPVLINTLDEKSQERLRNILRTIAAGIHNGLFMQYTGQQACRYCPYDRVCMGTQDSVSDLKKGDPAAADYLEMKGGFKLSGNATQ